MNEKEMKETIVNTDKIKSLFFEKIRKTDKPLARKTERVQDTMQKYEGL